MRLVALLLTVAALPARVIVVSLDGMGHQAFNEDPVTSELVALRGIARRGVQASGMTPHFPSTTANSHAAMYTGAWGDVNGIAGNSMPGLPRADHTILDRVNGYRSDALRAEPVWVAAGRQGLLAVAVQVPQIFPFSAVNTGDRPRVPPLIGNGYQTRLIAPQRFLRRGDVAAEPCGAGQRCFSWTAGPLKLRGVLRPERGAYRSMTILAEGGAAVTARLEPLESKPPRGRELARNFSQGLYLDDVPDCGPAVMYFRLFEIAAGGSDFLLYHSPIHELAIHHGGADPRAIARRLLREAGAFLGNGPGRILMREPFPLGTPLWRGGDGTAERRFLEVAELVTRQAIRHARWYLSRYPSALHIGYLNYPDEFEHNWKGNAGDARWDAFRRWGYAIVDRLVSAYAAEATASDHLIFVSDHGMTPVTHEVAVNAELRRAGLLELDPKGAPDPRRTRALYLRNCVLLNTSDRKGGIVPSAGRDALIARVGGVLRRIVDAGGRPVVTRIYDGAADAARLGFGGPAGADLCFDFAPGYQGIDVPEPPVVRRAEYPTGVHGFDPTRADMEAILIGVGPRMRGGVRWPRVRGIDVAPLIADLMGIDPPRDARGKSPLR
jgi:predicted AlkP superfamily phosphohydrolase/phosphomutase